VQGNSYTGLCEHSPQVPEVRSMPEIDESGDDEAVVIACIQELDEFIASKLRRYPTGAIALAAGTQLEGLLGALFDERLCTADEVRALLREIESGVLDPQRRP